MNDVAITALLIVALFAHPGQRRLDRPDAARASPGSACSSSQLAPGRRRDGDHDLGLGLELDADRAAAVHLDGRDPVSHAAVSEDMFRGLAPWLEAPARAACCTPT